MPNEAVNRTVRWIVKGIRSIENVTMRTLVAILCVSGLLSAQERVQLQDLQKPAVQPRAQPGEDRPQPIDDQPIKVTTQYVMAPVNVLDKDGKPVTGLTVLDFRLFDNGKLQTITEDVATHPISLVVCVQANSAVAQVLPQIQRSSSLYDSLVLGEAGEISLIGFDHRIQNLSDGFTSDPFKIREAFKKLRPGSSTAALNDAAMAGINLLRNRDPHRKRILLLISESRDQGSELRVRDVMTASEFANVAIYSVNISRLVTQLTAKVEPNRPSPIPANTQPLPGGYLNTPTVQTQMDMGNWVPVLKEIFIATKAIFVPNPLEVFTKYSGGKEYSFMTQRGLDQAISDIGQDLHNQYLLTYNPNNKEDAGFHEITVQVALQGVKVFTRQGYWWAGKQE
jgi:VWFA-related protein